MIEIANLHFAYRKKPVFTGLSLRLEPGHIYGLLGKNGTGKSTLLRSIAGLLYPRSGSIQVLGYTPGKRLPDFLQQIFLVPEDFHLPPISVKKWVQSLAPFYPLFDHNWFEKLLVEFEIPTLHRLDEMSYGQQKKALISFALAANTKILLMDEPTNGLDILSKSQFRKVIVGSSDEEKCIVISTHQVRDLENLIDRVTVIDEGKILFDQTMDSISTRLQFKLSFDTDERALYCEQSLKGNALILPNPYGEESKPDLEMLYKAIVLNNSGINAIFKDQGNNPDTFRNDILRNAPSQYN